MALTEHYYTKFFEGQFYHVYNRAVDRKPLFTQEKNYYFFLLRIVKYVIPFVDVYAFCLLGNHFHLLVKIKTLQKDLTTLKELSNQDVNLDEEERDQNSSECNCHYFVSGAFRKMFQSYAMAFNKQEGRVGTLFQTPFKRSWVDTEAYLMQMIYYIHFNPQKHGLIGDFRRYPYSSYPYYVKKTEGYWFHEDLLKIFESNKGFMDFHNQINDDPNLKYLIENE